MKNYRAVLRGLSVVLAFAVLAVAADAPPLTFNVKAFKVPGSRQTDPGGINNAGVTIGLYQDKTGVWHGFILNAAKTKKTTLDNPKGANTFAYNLNPNGPISVVGVYTRSGGAAMGFLYKERKYTDIPGPKGAVASVAACINDHGAIVGNYTDSSGAIHGFLKRGKAYKTLDVPSAKDTFATGINNAGIIVLTWIDSNGLAEAARTNNSGKTYRTINFPGATQSYAQDINTAGDIVYQWFDSSNHSHGGLHRGKKFYQLDV